MNEYIQHVYVGDECLAIYSSHFNNQLKCIKQWYLYMIFSQILSKEKPPTKENNIYTLRVRCLIWEVNGNLMFGFRWN